MEKKKKFFDLEEWKTYWRDGGKELYYKIYNFDVKASLVAATILVLGFYIFPQLETPALILGAIVGLISPCVYGYLENKKYKQNQALKNKEKEQVDNL